MESMQRISLNILNLHWFKIFFSSVSYHYILGSLKLTRYPSYRIVPKIVPILNDNLWYYVSFGDIRIRRSLGEKAN
jgi:hypothetical protein